MLALKKLLNKRKSSSCILPFTKSLKADHEAVEVKKKKKGKRKKKRRKKKLHFRGIDPSTYRLPALCL